MALYNIRTKVHKTRHPNAYYVQHEHQVTYISSGDDFELIGFTHRG